VDDWETFYLRSERGEAQKAWSHQAHSTPTELRILARGWRNAVKPTPGQRHQKIHQPQRGCGRACKTTEYIFSCFMAKAGMRNTSGIDSGTDATPLGLGYPEYGVPRVGSVPLRQPRAEIRIPVGDEEPSPPPSKVILPTAGVADLLLITMAAQRT
jgi:hypothetical protein